MESFIDELAHAAGKAPYQYRRKLIVRNPVGQKGIGGFARRNEWLTALDMVAKMSGWGTPLPEGWARGIAIDDRRRPTRNSTTVVAEVHTVSVSRRGQVKLHRVDVVFDKGFTDDAMNQECTIKDGRVVETNFDTYPVSRMSDYPLEVNIGFLKTDHWAYGTGEEAIQQVAPAICNAIFRVR